MKAQITTITTFDLQPADAYEGTGAKSWRDAAKWDWETCFQFGSDIEHQVTVEVALLGDEDQEPFLIPETEEG
jgi:hypothetical protein